MTRKLLLVDDHEIFRAGVSGLIGSVYPEYELLQAGDATSAVELMESNSIDIIVLDHELPDTNGLDLVPKIRQSHPDIKLIIMTGAHSGTLVRKFVAAGADAVLAKRGKGDELLEILGEETRDDAFVSDSFADDLAKTDVLKQLTPREAECLELLLDGLSTQQIADAMSVSFKTAETHRSNVMSKLDVHSYGELIALAADIKHRT